MEVNGTYVAILPDDESANNIFDYCIKNSIKNPLSIDEIHSTVLYSRRECPALEALGPLAVPLIAEPDYFDIWNVPANDGKQLNILVLVLKCDDLVTRHNTLRSEHNASHDYDMFIPHITFSYQCGIDDVSDLPLFDKPIKLDYEFAEPLNDDEA